MKRPILISCVAVLMAMTSAKADTLPPPIIGIVEQATLDNSAAFKSILAQVEKKRAEIQKEMTAIENKLKAQDKQLTEDQKKLSEAEFSAKRADFEKQVHDAQEKIEVRRAQIELAVDEAKKKVYEAFLKVAEEVRKEVGANIIIYQETVVTADKPLNVTKQVQEKLDKALSTVPVTYPSEEAVRKQLQQQQPQ